MKGLGNLALKDVPGGVIVPVKAVPGASRDQVVGVLGDCLKIATSAPAEKGKANAAIAALLAAALGVDRKSVQLFSGPASPRKEFLIIGLSADGVRRLLNQVA